MDATFLVYNRELPVYSGAVLLTVVFGSFFACSCVWEVLNLQVGALVFTVEVFLFFCLQLESSSYKHLNRL